MGEPSEGEVLAAWDEYIISDEEKCIAPNGRFPEGTPIDYNNPDHLPHPF
jgi:hypothetical protein